MANIGLAWVNPAPLTKPENVVNFAKKCEAMGCHSMWTIDRIVYDNLEPLTVLAAAAGATQKIRLGTSVLLANLRHPSHVAKIISTLDFISNGRLTVGLGFGSRENDYKAVEIPFEHRGSRAVEQVQLMKRLWTEDNVTHKGRFYNVENLTVGPKPIQKPHPPIWTGGSAEVALKRAGTWANGFICGSSAIPDFPATWEKIAGYAKAAGRDPNKINKAGLTFMAIDDDQNKAVKTVEDYVMRYYGRLRVDVANTSLVGAPSAIIDRIGAFLSKGLDTLIIGLADPDPRQLDLFGEKVLPKVK
ncbi:MAG TPA: LLM class flavin-dependent oxidoreductase [Candidatus Limnocylindrales bacterium]|nr:LLM class flavin-dependent oxidoreductase [Candidatus Limnocylindrales bacterium]